MKRKSLHPVVWVFIALGLLGIILAIAIPAFVKSRNTASQEACIRNMRMIDGGRYQSALITERGLPPQVDQPVSPPIVAAARDQVGKTVTYDPAYVGLEYPGGDVPIERGVCTDVVIRALRDAMGMDLQKLIHEDMKGAFASYPKIWDLSRPDRNIDHRRVPNMRTYFKRKGYALETSKDASKYLPGDLVTCTVGGNRPHIMIVSDRKTASGVPMVIHNIGSAVRETAELFSFPITGHYRITSEAPSP